MRRSMATKIMLSIIVINQEEGTNTATQSKLPFDLYPLTRSNGRQLFFPYKLYISATAAKRRILIDTIPFITYITLISVVWTFLIMIL